jgi:hypothetical protein
MADYNAVELATAAGMPPNLAAYMPKVIQVESSGNPNAKSPSGTYTGLFQMGPTERKKYGGDSAAAGTAMYADSVKNFEQKYGRDPTPTEMYLSNQQGPGGLANHLANPGGPAWQAMYNTAEGQQKGQDWAKRAVWGNLPDSVKKQFPGGVDTVTSGDFLNAWTNKFEGSGAPAPNMVAQGSPQGASQGSSAAPAMPAAAAPPQNETGAPDLTPANVLMAQSQPPTSAMAAQPPADNMAAQLDAYAAANPPPSTPNTFTPPPAPAPLPAAATTASTTPKSQVPNQLQLALQAARRGSGLPQHFGGSALGSRLLGAVPQSPMTASQQPLSPNTPSPFMAQAYGSTAV